jgi:hypothetical protein
MLSGNSKPCSRAAACARASTTPADADAGVVAKTHDGGALVDGRRPHDECRGAQVQAALVTQQRSGVIAGDDAPGTYDAGDTLERCGNRLAHRASPGSVIKALAARRCPSSLSASHSD